MEKKYTEEELVAGCIRNDRRFQELLYRKYFNSMMRMCMRYTKDQDIALEIINDGFLRVFKKLDMFAFTGSLEGWIRKLVFHSLSDYFKRQNKQPALLAIEDRDKPATEMPFDQLYFEDIIRLVDMLPESTRQVFYLYAIEGYTHQEIGDMVGISDGTSKWHLSMARQKLREMIQVYQNPKTISHAR